MSNWREFENTSAVTVAAAASGTVIFTCDGTNQGTDGYGLPPAGRAEYLCFEAENVGASNAFDVFKVQVQMHKNAAWVDYMTSWAAAGSVLLFVSTDLAALATESTGSAILKLSGVHSVRFVASGNGGTTTAKVRGTFFDMGVY